MIADVNGGNPRVLAAAPPPTSSCRKPRRGRPTARRFWRPRFDASRNSGPGTLIDAKTGTAQAVGDAWGFVREVQWLADGLIISRGRARS